FQDYFVARKIMPGGRCRAGPLGASAHSHASFPRRPPAGGRPGGSIGRVARHRGRLVMAKKKTLAALRKEIKQDTKLAEAERLARYRAARLLGPLEDGRPVEFRPRGPRPR